MTSAKRRHPPSHARQTNWSGTIDMRSDLAFRRERAELANNAFMDAMERYARKHDHLMLQIILEARP